MKITSVVSQNPEAPPDPLSLLNITINEDESGIGPSSTESFYQYPEQRQEVEVDANDGDNDYEEEEEDEAPFCVITSTSGAGGISEPDSGHENSPLHVDVMELDDCDVLDYSHLAKSTDKVTSVGFVSGRPSSSNSDEATVTASLPIPSENRTEELEKDPIPTDRDHEEIQEEGEGMVVSVGSDNSKESMTDAEILEVLQIDDDGVDDCQVVEERVVVQGLTPGENPDQPPLYDVGTDKVLTESVEGNSKGGKVSAQPPQNKTGRRCFNCMGPHVLRNCPKPKRYERIRRNRKLILMSKERPSGIWKSYDETDPIPVELLETTYQDFKPGDVSDSLGLALGLGSEDLPPYIYKMRQIGYPPGYLQLAKETLAYGLRFNEQNEVVPLRQLQELNGLLKKIPDYPGFTSVSRGFFDDGEYDGVPYNPLHDTAERRKMIYWEDQYSIVPRENVAEARRCVNQYIASLKGFLKKLEKITKDPRSQMQKHSSERPSRPCPRSRYWDRGQGRGHTLNKSLKRSSSQLIYKQTTILSTSEKRNWFDKVQQESRTQAFQTLTAFGISDSIAASAANSPRNYHETAKLERQDALLKERRRRAAETVTTATPNVNTERSSTRPPPPSMMDEGRSRNVARTETTVGTRKRRISISLLEPYPDSIEENVSGNIQQSDDDDIMVIEDLCLTTNTLGMAQNARKNRRIRPDGAEPPKKKTKVNEPTGSEEDDDVQIIDSGKNYNRVANPLYNCAETSKTSGESSPVALESAERVNATAHRNGSGMESSAVSRPSRTSTDQESDESENSRRLQRLRFFPVNVGGRLGLFVDSPSLPKETESIPSPQSSDESDYYGRGFFARDNPTRGAGPSDFAAAEGSVHRTGDSSQSLQGTSTFSRQPPLANFAKGMAEIPFEEQPRSGRLSKILGHIQTRKENQSRNMEDVNDDTNESSHTQKSDENSIINLSGEEDEVMFVAAVDPKADKNFTIVEITDSSSNSN